MKLLKRRETWFHLFMILAFAVLAFSSEAQTEGRIFIQSPEGMSIIGGSAEVWPQDGESLNWVSGLSIGEGSFFQVPQRKETYLVGFNYYRGFTLRESGVVLVETDAFLYDLPQGSIDDRLMNDALVALLKRGIRVDITRRGEWLEIGPWSKPTNRAMIFDTRNIKPTPRE